MALSPRWFPRLWSAVPLIAALSSCGAGDGRSLLSRLKAAIGSETEPNATTATATPIGGSTQARLRGDLYPQTDTDYYSFTGAAGDRVSLATMTRGALYGGVTVADVLDRDGTTVLETDQHDGTLGASSIAGTPLPGAGTYFIRLTATVNHVHPYDLYFRHQTASGDPEVEPNDTSATAQPFPASGFVDGSIATATDVDLYSISLNAGDTVFLSLDLLPARTGTATDGALGFGPFAGGTQRVDASGTYDSIPSEALFATVKTAGTYFIDVDIGRGTVTGNYRLSATVFPRDPVGVACTAYASTDVPKTIPSGPGSVTSVINVPGNPIVGDLTVSLGMTHLNPPDLEAHLTAPGGNIVGLLSDVASSSFPDVDVTLDQAAAAPVDWAGVVNNEVRQPPARYRLYWFNGQPAGGTWKLTVFDDVAGNGGTLDSWALQVCQPAPATCPDGGSPTPVASFDFETGAAGFTHSGSSDNWALGTPSASAAPITNCNGGTLCWKTNLTGPYTVPSNQDLVSPPIDLTTAVAPIRVSWAMKYQIESVTYAHAWVEIQDSDGSNPTRLWEWRDGAMHSYMGTPTIDVQESAGWGTTTADVSSYAGHMARLVFHLDAILGSQYAGLAVDDVSVNDCRPPCGDGIVQPNEQCDLGALNGASDSCCTLSCRFRAGASSYICRAATSACDADEFCTGSSGACPADAKKPDGTACDVNACTSPDTCQGGVCTAGAAVSCDDGNACTTDLCNPATGCVHANTCKPDAGGADGGGADGGGGGGNGGCGCASLGGGGAELAALQAIGALVMAMRRRAGRRTGLRM